MTQTGENILVIVPWFLFPKVSGGRIRTVDVLTGLKRQGRHITLTSPAPADWEQHKADLESICDRFFPLPETNEGGLHHQLKRTSSLMSKEPVSVASMQNSHIQSRLSEVLKEAFDLVIVDFVHTMKWLEDASLPPVCVFTHNVETEIFERQAKQAATSAKRWLWRSQAEKMHHFEKAALEKAASIIAVSARDKAFFEESFSLQNVVDIPTGMDTDALAHVAGDDASRDLDQLVFTGNMDWSPNRDALSFLLQDVWPSLAKQVPQLTLVAAGKGEVDTLSRAAQNAGAKWSFTGFVDDIKPYITGAGIYVIPLRVGGGTRLKAAEAMALGTPIVSTALGVEGLDIEPEVHYLQAETPGAFVQQIVRLRQDRDLAAKLSAQARAYIEGACSVDAVAQRFWAGCQLALGKHPHKTPNIAA